MRRFKLARFLMIMSRLLPAKFPVKSLNIIPKPIFVFGSGRNGSSLLNRMLNQHPSLFAPTEQYFLGPTIFKFHLYRHLINWRDLVKIVVGELDESSGSHTWETGHDPKLTELFESKDRSLQFLVSHIYHTYGFSQKAKFTNWVDTSAHNTLYHREIYRSFPNAHYFFLVRDGRDVINSYAKGGKSHFGNLSQPKIAASHWLDSIKAYEWMKKHSQVSLIKYEELVNDPINTLTKICDQLNVEFFPTMLDFYKQEIPKGMLDSCFDNVRKQVFNTSIGIWQRELDPQTIKSVLPDIKSGLVQFDYL